MTRYSLKVPPFQIMLGSDDITDAVVGFSFRHPLAEPSTPLIWTGTIEMYPVRSGFARSFFDDEVNPSRWLSGLQPIDVYFESTLWQRFRIKPNGYRFNQDNGQAEIEITDIIGILDSYQPSADAPEFKTGQNNPWNNLAVKLIQKQSSLMGRSVTVQTPPYGIGGIYKVPRSIKGSYVKEAQKMAGERGYWMWSDQEVIKWAEYPQTAQNIVWQKSRKELLNFTRQQGLDPVKAKITVSATHEDVDVCQDKYPKVTYTFANSDVAILLNGAYTSRRYNKVSSRIEHNFIASDQAGAIAPEQELIKGLRYPVYVDNKFVSYAYQKGNIVGTYINGRLRLYGAIDRTLASSIDKAPHVYRYTKRIAGNPALILFGGQVDQFGRVSVQIPQAKGYTVTKLNGGGGYYYDWWLKYKKNGFSFDWDWQIWRYLLEETDITTYEDVPFEAQNASKIISRVISRSEPWAKFPTALQYASLSDWFSYNPSNLNTRYITERITTKYRYREIFRDDIIVAAGQKLYEISSIDEVKDQVYFAPPQTKLGQLSSRLVTLERTYTVYTKECQGRWIERKEVSQNKGQSKTSAGYLFGVQTTETVVNSIPEITYRPAPYPVIQKPLLGSAVTNYAGISPFVNDNEFVNADTLTTKGELEAYAARIGRLKWQRHYSRELACGYGTVLNYKPFQGVYAANGAYIRDRFGVSLNREGDSWQFVEDGIGNKTGSIPEIQTPPLPFPLLLTSTLNIGDIPHQNLIAGVPTSISLSAAGGATPYVFSSVSLPLGLSIIGNILRGAIASAGTTTATITVTDNLGATDSTTFDIIVIAIVPTSIASNTYSFVVELNEVYSFTGFNGLPLPIDATYDDLTEYRFAISPVIISDLVINVIRLETPIIDLKLAVSNLSLYSIALNSNISIYN